MNPAVRLTCMAVVLAGLLPAMGEAVANDAAPDLMLCMSPREARSAVADGRALAFARVKRSAESASGGEVLRAQLCQVEGRLAYVLTVLRHGGQVITMVVDAENGQTGSTRPSPRNPRLERREAGPSG